MKLNISVLGLILAALAGCGEPVSLYDVDAHASSTAPASPPKGRIWLRRNGETRLWWADEVRREPLVTYASSWDLVDSAEAAGVSFIEVTPDAVIGRNARGEVVATFATNPWGCVLPEDYR